MSNVIEDTIDIDFLEVLTLTNDIKLTIFESLTLTTRMVNDCMQLLTVSFIDGIMHASVVVTFGKNWPFFRQ